jgi:cysteine-rich repeat protein
LSLRIPLLISLLNLLLASTSMAVIIDSATGTENTTAPPDDPGWLHVARRGATTAVYVGNGWVLTASHVGAGTIRIDGVNYPPVAGSELAIIHDGLDVADLVLFRVDPVPPLPQLPIRSSQPAIDDAVVMMGNGRNRGAATSFTIPPSLQVHHGYEWDTTKNRRWGSNIVSNAGVDVQIGNTTSRGFATAFTRFESDDEGHAADGDSGGGVFIKNGGSWELAGIMIAVETLQGQPPALAVYENSSWMVDLSYYSSQILDVITPVCGNGLITSDEDCDDGNTLDGDCCSSTCQFEPNGSPCEDGLFCSEADQCDGAGVCESGTADPCEDNDACTTHTCNEVDLCEYSFDPAPECAPSVPISGPPGRLILLISLAAIGAVWATHLVGTPPVALRDANRA